MPCADDRIRRVCCIFYHRLRSPTQTNELAGEQIRSGRICGRAAWYSQIPSVKAYPGPLPDGASGIEFVTSIAPTPGASTPSVVKW
jgi:hypothetical protein